MKAGRIFLSLAVLASTLLGINSVQAAQTCKFVGETKGPDGKQSACVRVNGKLFLINYPKKKVSQLTVYEKTKLKAYQEIRNAISTKPLQNIKLQYSISPNISSDLKKEFIQKTEIASQLYDQFFTQPEIINVYFQTSKDQKYIRNHPIMGRDASDFDQWFKDWENGSNTSHLIGLIAKYVEFGGEAQGHTGVLVSASSSKATLGLYAQQVVAHEYFHVIQDRYKYQRDKIGYEISPTGFDLYYPPIFREGSANTIATAVSMKSFEDYLLFYQIFISANTGTWAPKIFNEQTSTKKIIETLNQIEYSKRFPDAHWTAYPLGSLVFEWFIAEYGFNAYKKLIFNQEQELPFEENLKQAVGITLDQLYVKAAPHVLAGFKGSRRTT
jgi:hypothetical protein